MRIGVDIRGLLTGQRSGIEQYTLKVLEYLLKIDHENTYVLFYVAYRDYDDKAKKVWENNPWLRQPNVEVKKLVWIDFPLLLHALWKPLGWPWADKICGGLDVMWQPSPRLLPVSHRCRTVITFHDLVFEIFPQFYPWSSRLWQWQMSYPYLARMASHVIAVSQNTKRDLVEIYHLPPDKITVVYEGVEPAYYLPANLALSQAMKSKFNLSGDYLYYVGSLEPRKNVVGIIRGLNYLKQRGFVNIKLVISGGKSWLSEAVFAEVEKLHLSEEVIFTGPVTEEEKMAWLSGAQVFVFPSFYEGFGLPVLEAMAAGSPVVTSQVSSLPEVAHDAALLIDPYDQAQLNLALEKIITDPDLAKHLKQQGQAQARRFTWEETALQTLRVLLNGGK